MNDIARSHDAALAIPATYRTGRIPAIVQRFFVVAGIAMAASRHCRQDRTIRQPPSTAFANRATRLGKQLAKESVGIPASRAFGSCRKRRRPVAAHAAPSCGERSIDIHTTYSRRRHRQALQQSILDRRDRGVRIRPSVSTIRIRFQRTKGRKYFCAERSREYRAALFNPFCTGAISRVWRYLDIAVNEQRVNHRSQTKLLVADNASRCRRRNVATNILNARYATGSLWRFHVAGGRTRRSQLRELRRVLNSSPRFAKGHRPVAPLAPSLPERAPSLRRTAWIFDGSDIEQRLNKGDPLNGLLDGRLSFVWGECVHVADIRRRRKFPR